MATEHEHHDVRQQLRDVGLRVTAPRVAVLDVLERHPHSTADFVADQVRGRLGGVSTQTVYDVLRVSSERGLLRRIEPAGSPVRYERRTGDNHHHVVCRNCGVIRDVDCATGVAPCLAPDVDHGFVIDEAEVTYWGLCPVCHAAGAH
ncbi:MAG: transcriptional repressor [Gordonia sp.]|uniref:Fur family transcriptional regulator n=1 Tax=Williamsia sp. 1138 TaxID=1903117 RepID=UPI000A0F408A|nr:Fur family transcriptional regulator [Williamsia sp. 1138]MBA4023657.1 transcriptional repressor [Gordonia sp. (in: high G+C Gram-positive bacteria)]OZG29355.1 transcriptional repressor [Williamsia sp. 1138]